MRLYTFFIALFVFGNTQLQAQETILPKGLTEAEKLLLKDYVFPVYEGRSNIYTAPDGPVRVMAEWEEVQAIVITWTGYPIVLAEIVRHAKKECRVIILTNDTETTRIYLAARDIDDENVTFLNAPYNTVWVRDYGANAAYLNEVDSLILVDWIYNRPRPNDDLSPGHVAELMGLPLYVTGEAPSDLVNTGGNFMSDGLGKGFASYLVMDENKAGNSFGVSAKTEDVIDSIMQAFLGLHTYVKMPNLPFDGIHHIDMHMKLLDEETLLMGEYPDGISDGPQIEANLQYVLNQFKSTFGTDFKVIRIPMPPDGNNRYPSGGGRYRTYTNSLIVNKTVLVPVYEEKHDTTALRIYKEAMPGYSIIGIDCNDIIRASGAIHCITKEIGVSDPLLINHQPLRDHTEDESSLTFQARIRHRSGIASAFLHFRSDTTEAYASAEMTLVDPQNHIYEVELASTAGKRNSALFYYYIEAIANNGKTITRPMPGPQGPWKFEAALQSSSTYTFVSNIKMEPVFPNPASAITCIPVFSDKNQEASIRLTDMLGRTQQLIFNGNLPVGESKYFIQAQDFAPGLYLINLETSEGTSTQKLLIR
jgi:agmatine deiminase